MTTQEWRNHGVRIVSSKQLDFNTPQTPGMTRAAAINRAMAGMNKLWAGMVHIHANAKTAPHHHGALESIIYIVSGRARMRWGEKLELFAHARPGDFIFVPPFVPHQEINADENEPLACVVVRSNQQPVVVNLDIPAVNNPEEVYWIDPAHPTP
ncbi:MAG TPA: cupin domain-containing protein [Candidatus Limnocylindria bacterium]|nr:cupin domain-containing protein [Candidatus Limnocylindria bacterium]